MDVYLIDESGLTRRHEEELPDLLVADEGVVWVDIPQCRLYEARGPRAACSASARSRCTTA